MNLQIQIVQNMNNLNNRRSLILVVVLLGAVVMAALRFSTPKKPTASSAPPAQDLMLPATESGSKSVNVTAIPSQPTPTPSGPLPLLGRHLGKIGQCLQINNSLDENADLSFASLQSSLRGPLGELVVNDLEWKNVHLLLPNGEKRRLRLEIEGTGEEATALRLNYYGVDKEDLPIPLPLTQEQSINPSEAFIASLENEGQVTLREEARRAIYNSGAELSYTERNGALSEFEILFEGRSVKCQELQSPSGFCRCF